MCLIFRYLPSHLWEYYIIYIVYAVYYFSKIKKYVCVNSEILLTPRVLSEREYHH